MSTKKIIQLVLFLAITAAAVRVAIIWAGRQDSEPEKPNAAALGADAYVTPKKLRAYDLASARELTRQPAWVQMGYRNHYFPFDMQARRTNFGKRAGTLGPLERLEIVDVVAERDPEGKGAQRAMAVFQKDGGHYSFPIGVGGGDTWEIYADELLFIQDPRELYKHWPTEIWDAVSRHEVQPGMTPLQVQFAVGAGASQTGTGDTVIMEYPNNGRPLRVVYRAGKVAEVQTGEPARAGDDPYPRGA